MAPIMYSSPLRGSTNPKVEMRLRPLTPSFALNVARPWGFDDGRPVRYDTGRKR